MKNLIDVFPKSFAVRVTHKDEGSEIISKLKDYGFDTAGYFGNANVNSYYRIHNGRIEGCTMSEPVAVYGFMTVYVGVKELEEASAKYNFELLSEFHFDIINTIFESYKVGSIPANRIVTSPDQISVITKHGLHKYFKKVKIESVYLHLGVPSQKIKINIGSIECEGSHIPISAIKEILDGTNFNGVLLAKKWDIGIPNIKIGCTTFTRHELQNIIDTYNQVNFKK